MASESKKVYHPLVLFFFYKGMLSREQLQQIPKTTINYWRKNTPDNMFGYQWVSSFSGNYSEFQNIQKHKIIFKAARLSCKIAESFSGLFSNTRTYKRALKNNMAQIIATVDYLSNEIPFDKACCLFKITTQQYYRWKNKINCTASVLNLCFKTHAQQLTIAETTSIKDALHLPLNLNKKLTTIWYSLMRQGKLYCSRSTFYKYVKQLDERMVRVKPKALQQTIKATRIFEYIHIDTTFLPTMNEGMVRAVIIKDNFSKKILHQGVVDTGASKWIAALVKEMFELYGLHQFAETITLITDGGSENKGGLDKWVSELDEELLVAKKTARTKAFVFTNNEIESVFNIFKNEFLRGKDVWDKTSVKRLLMEFKFYYDNERYPIALFGLTPQEVFDGAAIDRYRFTANIKDAQKDRVRVNRAQASCRICVGKGRGL